MQAALADPKRVLGLGAPLPRGEARHRLIGARQLYKGTAIVAFFGDKIRPLFEGNRRAFVDPLRERRASTREPGREDADTVRLAVRTFDGAEWRERACAMRPELLDQLMTDR